MVKDEKLRQAIRNLYDDFNTKNLPQYVMDRLRKIMKSNSIRLNKTQGGSE